MQTPSKHKLVCCKDDAVCLLIINGIKLAKASGSSVFGARDQAIGCRHGDHKGKASIRRQPHWHFLTASARKGQLTKRNNDINILDSSLSSKNTLLPHKKKPLPTQSTLDSHVPPQIITAQEAGDKSTHFCLFVNLRGLLNDTFIALSKKTA
jgi:hypothetical protein